MKKIFTLVAMATLAFSANAQTESAFINLNVVSEAAVDKNTAESVTGGTELCSTDNVTMKVAYDDTYARIALWGETDAVNTVSVGGVSYDMPMGLQGQTNPDPNKIDGGQTSGAVFQFDVKADGYLYVFGKFAGNKNYYVWEGDVVNKVANPVAYTMVAALASDGTAVGYTLPADAEGYYTVGAGYDNGSKYLAADQNQSGLAVSEDVGVVFGRQGGVHWHVDGSHQCQRHVDKVPFGTVVGDRNDTVPGFDTELHEAVGHEVGIFVVVVRTIPNPFAIDLTGKYVILGMVYYQMV